jgi:crotonobetainyl-CoA:carnitine CoA-transferase CaiB-like acyl-CoA transferase
VVNAGAARFLDSDPIVMDAPDVLRVSAAAEDAQVRDLIATAVARRSRAELARELESAGVWTEVCRDDAEVSYLNDPGLEALGLVRLTVHPELGAVREVGPLFSLSRSQVGNDRPIHDLGEQSVDILRDVGLSRSQVEALLAAGAVRQREAVEA